MQYLESLAVVQDCERCLHWVLGNVFRPGTRAARCQSVPCCGWQASPQTLCAGDCIHLFHVVTHDTARSLECFSRPMEEDLPPEYHQEMLVRFSTAGGVR